ncbi:MAG: hypothetical protein ACTHLZ_02385 [Tepidisphaeraceae bacterium]
MFAGVREKISKSGWIGPLAGATLLVVGLVAIVFEVSGGSSSIPGVSDKAFFTTNEDAVGDEALNALFVDDINKIPPFSHEGKTAYGAVVYRGTGGRRWINSLFRYDEKTKEKLEAKAKENLAKGIKTGPYSEFGDTGREIKKPGPGPWLKPSDPAYSKVGTIAVPAGVDSADVDIATP